MNVPELLARAREGEKEAILRLIRHEVDRLGRVGTVDQVDCLVKLDQAIEAGVHLDLTPDLTPEKIEELMREGAELRAKVHDELGPMVKGRYR